MTSKFTKTKFVFLAVFGTITLLVSCGDSSDEIATETTTTTLALPTLPQPPPPPFESPDDVNEQGAYLFRQQYPSMPQEVALCVINTYLESVGLSNEEAFQQIQEGTFGSDTPPNLGQEIFFKCDVDPSYLQNA